MSSDTLTMIEALFVNEYCVDWNASAAVRRVCAMGFEMGANEARYPAQAGYYMLRIPRVRAEVERVRERVLGISELNVEMVVKDIRRVLNADPKEMTEHHKDCCRFCNGIDNDYQFTKNEMRHARERHEASDAFIKRGIPFNERGGIGFDPRNTVNDQCPECHGRGVMTIIAHDTRTMSEAASALYIGVKPGKHGTEILTRSKDQARKDAAAFLGMNKETINLLTKDVKDMSDEELALIASGATK